METTELSYSQSDENCQRKGGKLYEPQSSASNTAVYSQFKRVFGLSDVRWIGINNLTNLGYRYNSNQQNLSFDIDQMWDRNDNQNVDHKCVVQDDPLWWDRSCSQTYQSLCEIILSDESNDCQTVSLLDKMKDIQGLIENNNQGDRGNITFYIALNSCGSNKHACSTRKKSSFLACLPACLLDF